MNPPRKLHQCNTCRHWLPSHGNDRIGTCKRYPPAFVSETTRIGRRPRTRRDGIVATLRHPHTAFNDWCGEHSDHDRPEVTLRADPDIIHLGALLRK